MPESQRQPVPRNDGGELDTATAFLSFARQSVLKKAEGLDEEQLRRVLVGSGTSILGLVQHLTVSEHHWIGAELFLAHQDPDDWDFTMVVPAGRTVRSVLDAYREAIAVSDASIRRVRDPALFTERVVDGRRKTVRWVIAHLTSETVRHAGHADILREQIDGITGR